MAEDQKKHDETLSTGTNAMRERIKESELLEIIGHVKISQQKFLKYSEQYKLRATIIFYTIIFVLCVGLITFIYTDEILSTSNIRLNNRVYKEFEFLKSQSDTITIKTK